MYPNRGSAHVRSNTMETTAVMCTWKNDFVFKVICYCGDTKLSATLKSMRLFFKTQSCQHMHVPCVMGYSSHMRDNAGETLL